MPINKYFTLIFAFLAVLFCNFAAFADGVLPAVDPKGSCMVIASEATATNSDWAAVITALREKYDSSLIIYPGAQVSAALEELKRVHPRYAVFVTRPEEAGRSFVVAVHRMTRKLDDDPYTDVMWGIITGYDASDALRIAKHSDPLVIKSAASSMGPGCFNNLESGFASSETDEHKFWIKKAGAEAEELKVAPDPVQKLAEAFNTQSPDCFETSGHATEKDWQVIYNKNLGSFRCDNGQLYGLNSKNERFNITSPGVKIYLPFGNCLIGHIPGSNCMATAWMHTGGVHQMFGYTAVTFHGYMGWGIGSYFGNQYSLSESFYYNNQSLIWELQQLFPAQANTEFEEYNHGSVQSLARKHKISDSKLLGHLWDRDTVAFYGDPAWEARRSLADPAWRVTWKHTGESVAINVDVLKEGKWGNRPLAIPFPVRLGRVRGIECSDNMTPLVTDDFALLPVMDRGRRAGDKITLRFGAFPIDAVRTSAGAAPMLAKAADAVLAAESESSFDPRSIGLTEENARQISVALHYAGVNSGEIIKALRGSGKGELADMNFMVANMPLRDLTELGADFLLENMRYARKGFDEAPWKDAVSQEIYRDYILPYASLSEKREPWRKLFYEKLKPLVKDCKTPGEAAIKLNQSIYETFSVKYNATNRPRADQGPMESIKAGFASCTGLAVLLVDACRAVGVPARIAGVAEWTKGPGNHTWVEVWDNEWHCIGASESKALDDVWFGKAAAGADTADPLKRVYAARFSRTTLYFPLAWNPYAQYVPAVDVTDWYKNKFGGKN